MSIIMTITVENKIYYYYYYYYFIVIFQCHYFSWGFSINPSSRFWLFIKTLLATKWWMTTKNHLFCKLIFCLDHQDSFGIKKERSVSVEETEYIDKKILMAERFFVNGDNPLLSRWILKIPIYHFWQNSMQCALQLWRGSTILWLSSTSWSSFKNSSNQSPQLTCEKKYIESFLWNMKKERKFNLHLFH